MIWPLLPVYFYLLFSNLIVGFSGVVIGLYIAFRDWSICQSQMDDQLASIVPSCPVVGRAAIISNFQSIVINHICVESSIMLHIECRIPLELQSAFGSRLWLGTFQGPSNNNYL
jgi:hypothetical protein